MIPIRIATPRKIFGQYDGFSFFIFIFYWKHCRERRTLILHEMIHFYQQVELLFIAHWLLYVTFYVFARIRGKSHDHAYRANPFEKEAYDKECDLHYLKNRKIFAWLKYLSNA